MGDVSQGIFEEITFVICGEEAPRIQGLPLLAVRDAIKSRHTLRGYIADYPTALAITRRAIETGREPELESWF